jgi:uncharacterized membrane protein YphA (DoxX/SURF4 family)
MPLIIILLALLGGAGVAYTEQYQSLFLAGLVVLLILAVIFHKKFRPWQVVFCRTLLGMLFMFSGFVKGVDPVGTQYQIVDYFIAFGTEWAIPTALVLSVLLNAAEFVLGALLFFNIRIRLVSWLVLLMMILFTVVTLNDAINNPVPDCGCFGKFLILTNWQTFYKNLVIGVFLAVIFLNRNRIKSRFPAAAEWGFFLFFAAAFTGLQVYSIRHLPILDFMDWKVGKRMVATHPMPAEFYLTFRNLQTGEEKEYLSPDYPFSDSVWMSQWEFVKQRVVDPNIKPHQLTIQDAEGNDFTRNIIENPDYQFILVAYDLQAASLKNIGLIRDLAILADIEGHTFTVLTSSTPEIVREFELTHQLGEDYYYGDDTVLQTMVRSNPGLLLMKDAVILGKWHYNDIPDEEKLKKRFPGMITH